MCVRRWEVQVRPMMGGGRGAGGTNGDGRPATATDHLCPLPSSSSSSSSAPLAPPQAVESEFVTSLSDDATVAQLVLADSLSPGGEGGGVGGWQSSAASAPHCTEPARAAGHPLNRFAWGNASSLLGSGAPSSSSSSPGSGGGRTTSCSSSSSGAPPSAPPLAHRLVAELREWYEHCYRRACRPPPPPAAAEDDSGGDSEMDTAHRLTLPRRPQLVVRAPGRLLTDDDDEEEEEEGKAEEGARSGGGSRCSGAEPERGGDGSGGGGTTTTSGLDALEAAMRRALRPLTAAWERAQREGRRRLRQQQRRRQQKAPPQHRGGRAVAGRSVLAGPGGGGSGGGNGSSGACQTAVGPPLVPPAGCVLATDAVAAALGPPCRPLSSESALPLPGTCVDEWAQGAWAAVCSAGGVAGRGEGGGGGHPPEQELPASAAASAAAVAAATPWNPLMVRPRLPACLPACLPSASPFHLHRPCSPSSSSPSSSSPAAAGVVSPPFLFSYPLAGSQRRRQLWACPCLCAPPRACAGGAGGEPRGAADLGAAAAAALARSRACGAVGPRPGPRGAGERAGRAAGGEREGRGG